MEKYFSENWKPDYTKFKYSGWNLLKKIDIQESVLDIGCGYNLFKPYLPNLYGIDPANKNAHQQISIENYNTKTKYDVVLCLGSLNFGTSENVEPQVKKAVSLVKPGGRIYWRQNPGVGDHPWKGVEEVTFFPWTIELNHTWAKKYNCRVRDCKWDNSRIYAEWIKKIH